MKPTIDWDELVNQVNDLHGMLAEKPRQLRIGYQCSPGGILNAYREGDLTFNEAVKEIEQLARTNKQGNGLKRGGRLRKKAKPKDEQGEIAAARKAVYGRSLGSCELRSSPACWIFAGWERGHLCHIKHRGMRGKKWSRESWQPENLLWGCPPCHAYEHAGKKPVPKKPDLDRVREELKRER